MQTARKWRQFWNRITDDVCEEGWYLHEMLRDMARLEEKLREAQQQIALLAPHSLMHKYFKGGRIACGRALEGLPTYALLWEHTTCPTCLDAREEQQR